MSAQPIFVLKVNGSAKEEDAGIAVLKSRVGVALAVVLIAAATLVPATFPGGTEAHSGATLCVLCGERGLADFILNIGLFAPLGAALAALGWRWTQAIAVAGLLSLGIEALQISVIAGRDASIGDLVSNTLGAGAGWGLWWCWERRRTLSPKAATVLSSLVALTVVAVLMAGLWLLGPSFPDARYYLQWTADLGHMEVYGGEVLVSGVGPLELPGPPGPIERSDSVRALLRDGATIEVTIRAGPPPAGLAPIFSIYDHRQREIVLLGADGHDLVYRYRLKAAGVRLDGAEIRFPNALADVAAGEVVRLSVAPDTMGAAPGAQGYRANIGSRVLTSPGFTVGRTWTLLAHRPDWAVGLRRVLDLVWLAALFFPAGLVSRRLRDCGLAALLTAAGLLAVPPLLGFAMTSLPEAIAAVAGIALGGAVSPLTPDTRPDSVAT